MFWLVMTIGAWTHLATLTPGPSITDVPSLSYGRDTTQWHSATEDPPPQYDVENLVNARRRLRYDRRRRAEGLAYFTAHPQDPRKWIWFQETAHTVERQEDWIDFLGDTVPPYDTAAARQWAPIFSRWRAAFYATPNLSDSIKNAFRAIEMSRLQDQMSYATQCGRPPTVARVSAFYHLLLDFSHGPQACGPNCPRGSSDAREIAARYFQLVTGLFPRALQAALADSTTAFIRAMSTSPDTSLQSYGRLRSTLAMYATQPLPLPLTTVTGKSLTPATLHQRLILIDVWSLHCSSCIEGMEKLKPVYARYHDRGFEVISVGFVSGQAELPYMDKIMTQHALPWPRVVLDSTQSQAFQARFGFEGVPYHLLLDGDGHLIVDGQVSDARLHEELVHALGADATQ